MYSDMYTNTHTLVNRCIYVDAHIGLVTATHTSKHLLKQYEGTMRKDVIKRKFTFLPRGTHH